MNERASVWIRNASAWELFHLAPVFSLSWKNSGLISFSGKLPLPLSSSLPPSAAARRRPGDRLAPLEQAQVVTEQFSHQPEDFGRGGGGGGGEGEDQARERRAPCTSEHRSDMEGSAKSRRTVAAAGSPLGLSPFSPIPIPHLLPTSRQASEFLDNGRSTNEDGRDKTESTFPPDRTPIIAAAAAHRGRRVLLPAARMQ